MTHSNLLYSVQLYNFNRYRGDTQQLYNCIESTQSSTQCSVQLYNFFCIYVTYSNTLYTVQLYRFNLYRGDTQKHTVQCTTIQL